MRYLLFLLTVSFFCLVPEARKQTVVVDAETHNSLANASVFDIKGNIVGICDAKGRFSMISDDVYPVIVRCLGYEDVTVNNCDVDTAFMRECVMVLPEMVVESKKHSVLHILAYVREYSTLSTFTDTVTLFREKMVDFMKPITKSKFKGWSTPRVLNVRSYYRFTNNQKLDSVSDRCIHHFSWTDWMGLPPSASLPLELCNKESASDTIYGKYSVTELWRKNNDRVNLDIDVLADTSSRKWVPNLSLFFHKDIDFERFRVGYNYDNVVGSVIDETNLTGYSFNIESNGRGRGMFMFNRRDETFYVTTYCEIYVVEKEYVTEKEARKWGKAKIGDDMGFYVPSEAPELQFAVRELVERVERIDHNGVRLSSVPDISHIGYRAERVSPGQQVLRRLKGIFGIDKMLAKRKWDNNYNKFRRNQQHKNREQHSLE